MAAAAVAVLIWSLAFAGVVAATCRDLGLVLVNDITMWRQHSNNVERVAQEYFNLVATMYSTSTSSSSAACVRLHLLGQVTLRESSPDSIQYRTCFETGQCDWATSIDPSALLDSFTQQISDDALRSRDLQPHLTLLLTLAPFPGLTRGLSNQKTACTEQARAVISVGNSNMLQDAQIIAHEIGHILGMEHSDNPSSIMTPQSSSKSIPTKFSAQDLEQIALPESCSALSITEQKSRCGNGIVDDGEECDPGLSHDRCCNNQCQLQPECRCPESDPCCEGGKIAPAGQLCRPARNSLCDRPEFCNGVDSRCPLDEFVPSGCYCDDHGSVCFDGECVVGRQAQCRSSGMEFACAHSDHCRRLYCSNDDNDHKCSTFIEKTVTRGTPCGPGFVCVDGDCIALADADIELAALALGRFDQRGTWQSTPWGPCHSVSDGDCRQERRVECHSPGGCKQPPPAIQRVCSCPAVSSAELPAARSGLTLFTLLITILTTGKALLG